MKSVVSRLALMLLVLIPLSAGAETDSTYIGRKLGIDFYSQIDAAQDTLANKIVTARLNAYGTYRQLGKNCRKPMPWLDQERIDQKLLDGLQSGDYTLLMQLAASKKIILTTDTLTSLSECLTESYTTIRQDALRDQGAVENVGNLGIYMDGNTSNSDYDIITDLDRINSIIFSQKINYTGRMLDTNNAISDYLAGKSVAGLIAPLLPANSINPVTTGIYQNTPSSDTSPTASGSETLVASGSTAEPWSDVCIDPTKQHDQTSTSVSNMIDSGFLTDLSETLQGSTLAANGGAQYGTNGATVANDNTLNGSNANAASNTTTDYYARTPCSGVFCITVDVAQGQQNLLAGGKNNSIETILDKHLDMMNTVSWSDLAGQKMTNNAYQLPFLNVNIASKIAGARVYMMTAPQTVRTGPSEANAATDAATAFDMAYSCALTSAGLSADPHEANGVIGAGYVQSRLSATANTANAETPLNAVNPSAARAGLGCYEQRVDTARRASNKVFGNKLDEFQAFVGSVDSIITDILTSDTKLDTLPVQ